ncbi:NAD(P)H-hydrate dehydratase [Hutsoniella sourekii]|uniref:NAD(P)H-hydrate dehydratase n=1 Tax=Hutsoniella sourekii TaxID=87650 RepID=UPI0004894DAE|nr:NAD(P)H-hydrate dehydratase [Hutsoniella sourekii]
MQKITADLVQEWLPIRPAESHKGDYGRVLLIGGHRTMGGAIILAAKGSLYSGAGLLTVASDPSNKTALYSHLPEAMFLDLYDQEALIQAVQKNEIILLGPGLSRGPQEAAIMETVFHHIRPDQTLILDADGLHHFKKLGLDSPCQNFIITPHLGEWQYLTDLAPEEQSLTLNQALASNLGVKLVLKGHRTQIYLRDEIWLNTCGTPAQATGGMGDTLAGMIAGFLGQPYQSADQAILSAVYLHSYIAETLAEKQYVVLPSQISEQIPYYLKQGSH